MSLKLRARMARAGFAPAQIYPYEDPERGWTDPLDDDETRTEMRRFFAELWRGDFCSPEVPCPACGKPSPCLVPQEGVEAPKPPLCDPPYCMEPEGHSFAHRPYPQEGEKP